MSLGPNNPPRCGFCDEELVKGKDGVYKSCTCDPKPIKVTQRRRRDD